MHQCPQVSTELINLLQYLSESPYVFVELNILALFLVWIHQLPMALVESIWVGMLGPVMLSYLGHFLSAGARGRDILWLQIGEYQHRNTGSLILVCCFSIRIMSPGWQRASWKE